jgi:hypothetical protein
MRVWSLSTGTTRMTDRDALAALVAALEGYLAAKGRGELAWLDSFNRLLHALAAARRALEQA